MSHREAPATPETVYVTLVESQRCRGTTPTWGTVAISLPPAPPVDCPAFDAQVRTLNAAVLSAVPTIRFSPPVPPPRAA
jgi:hypothetical protein